VPTIRVMNRSAAGLETDKRLRLKPPKLVITSPPYSGVHVLYHRWQVDGRKETAAPFWIANRLDGAGSSYYTMGDRKFPKLETYFCNIRATMSSVASLADEHTIFSQMVAFSDRDWQLEQYLDTMKEAGLSEAFLPMLQGEGDGRLHAHAVAIGVLAKPTAKLGRRGQRRRAGAARRPRCRSSQKEIGGGPVQRSGRMRRRRLARAEQPKRALTRLLTRTNDSF